MWLHELKAKFNVIEDLIRVQFSYLIDSIDTPLHGVSIISSAILLLMLFLEFVYFSWLHRRNRGQIIAAYKTPSIVFAFNSFIGLIIKLDVSIAVYYFFEQYSILKVGPSFAWFIYCYLVWELSHYIFHYSCHKVRLLWCLHSPHHAPNHMNLSLSYVDFCLHGLYASSIKAMICGLLGVPITYLILIALIDTFWGSIIHINESIWPTGEIKGIVGQAILSPAHHRIHHSKNSEYLDKNYCNTFSLWDRIFHTYQNPITGKERQYGVNNIDPANFFEFYFGELIALYRDIQKESRVKNKVLYLFMPPGWRSS